MPPEKVGEQFRLVTVKHGTVTRRTADGLKASSVTERTILYDQPLRPGETDITVALENREKIAAGTYEPSLRQGPVVLEVRRRFHIGSLAIPGTMHTFERHTLSAGALALTREL